MKTITSDPLDRNRFPVDEWALVETEFASDDQGVTETVFAVGNGYLGLRGNLDEGRGDHSYGTFINGFHETWPIRHAEEAFGFARVGQTIVNVPDAKVIRLYVDDEPFALAEADVLKYTRKLDFRDGYLLREIEWRTPSGKLVLVTSRRLVSFADRVLQPKIKKKVGTRYILGYQASNSGMTVAVGAEHSLATENEWRESSQIDDDIAKHVYRVKAKAGKPIRMTKIASYHSSRGVPPRELADRCDRTLDRARETSAHEIFDAQRAWLDDFWARSDIELPGHPNLQQAIRWNIFMLAQSTARTDGAGIAAKGVTGSGYGGHYFWDTEIYVLPFLTYTAPDVARNALRFRHGMLDAARERATELNQRGALFPWRTINGLESSAYYAAGTAQYHIDADIVHALMQYVAATGDDDFLARGAVDILVETARLWADLGFWRSNGDQKFHIDGVTGPDEYTTVVDDNLYTNVMARANLWSAVRICQELMANDPAAYDRLVQRVDLLEHEIRGWRAAADAMEIPFDAHRGIHPQDAQFLDKELWDLDSTPESKKPLLLHYHPLVIYRFQVLKQADVVLALFLQGDEFTPTEKLRDFEYYDALTTGDSTLSAVVQSIIAAEVGHHKLARDYFLSSLFVDLADLHHNTADGVHVASTGGIWSALAFGFGGMRDHSGRVTFTPRLPADWERLSYRITIKGSRIRVDLTQGDITFTVEEGTSASVHVHDEKVEVSLGNPVTVPLADQGPRLKSAPPTTSDLSGMLRADGSVVTASIPTISVDRTEVDVDATT